MSNDDPVDKKESIFCRIDSSGYIPSPGIYKGHDLDFERLNYRLQILGSNIQDISLQIQELKELIQAKKNGE